MGLSTQVAEQEQANRRRAGRVLGPPGSYSRDLGVLCSPRDARGTTQD